MKSVQNGILLKKLNYSETSLILHFYTLENGFQAFLFQGGKKKKGNILQPLTLAEIEVYQRPDSDLGKISSVSPQPVLKNIPFHPVKSGLAFFIAELITQCLRSSDRDQPMFNFLSQEIQWLDDSNEITNYPIWFLLKFSDLQGFAPQITSKNAVYFDFEEGELVNHVPKGHFFIQDETVSILNELLSKSKKDVLSMHIQKHLRKRIIDHLINYYKTHISGFKTPKSLEIVQTVLNE